MNPQAGTADKAFIEVGGEPLVLRAVRKLQPQCATVLISANGEAGRFAPFGCKVVADTMQDAGPLAGLLAAMDHVAADLPDLQWLLTAPVDCPFLPENLAARLADCVAQAGTRAAIAASAGRRHFTCGLWHVSLAEDLRPALHDRSMRRVEDFAKLADAAQCVWPAEPFDPFMNVNRPEDLARAREIALQYAAPGHSDGR